MKESIALLFVVLWFAFAFFDFSSGRDTFVAYTAKERSEYSESDNLPRLLEGAITEYRIKGDKIIRTGFFVSEYEDCAIFDKYNWNCTYSDDSGTFGVKKGEYFVYSNLAKFPHLEQYEQPETLSRFEYIILGCSWDFASFIDTYGLQSIVCLLRPFMT